MSMNVRRRRRTIVNTAPAPTGLLVTTRVTATTAIRGDSAIQVSYLKIIPFFFAQNYLNIIHSTFVHIKNCYKHEKKPNTTLIIHHLYLLCYG